MNTKVLINQLLGKWIVQNTIYSSPKNYINSSITQINWEQINNNQQNFINKIKCINKRYQEFFLIQKNSNGLLETAYYLFLFSEETTQGNLIKLNNKFEVLSCASIRLNSSNSFNISHKTETLEIVESIHFVNTNLKLVKSIIKKNKECLGVSFSSEIKIK